MKVIITHRDTKILRYVFENRVATLPQIQRRFFSPTQRSVASRRVWNLCRVGCLRPDAFMSSGKIVRYFESTPKAYRLVRASWPIEVDDPHFRSESPQHDIRLGDCRFVFEGLPTFAEFYPENLLQSSSFLQDDPLTNQLARLQADAALLLSVKNGIDRVYGVELEISKKSPERYRGKLIDYYISNVVDGVLYICGDLQILNAVARADKEVRTHRRSKVHLATETSVLSGDGKMKFQSAEEFA